MKKFLVIVLIISLFLEACSSGINNKTESDSMLSSGEIYTGISSGEVDETADHSSEVTTESETEEETSEDPETDDRSAEKESERRWFHIGWDGSFYPYRDYPYTEETDGVSKIVQTYYIFKDEKIDYYTDPYLIAANDDIDVENLLAAVRVTVDLRTDYDMWIDDTWEFEDELSTAAVSIQSLIDDHMIYEGEARLYWDIHDKKMSFFNSDYFEALVARELEHYQFRDTFLRSNLADEGLTSDGNEKYVYKDLRPGWSGIKQGYYENRDEFLKEYGFEGQTPVKTFENESHDLALELFYDSKTEKACYLISEKIVNDDFEPFFFQHGRAVDSIVKGRMPETVDRDYKDYTYWDSISGEKETKVTLHYFDGKICRVTTEKYQPEYGKKQKTDDRYFYREDGTLWYHDHSHAYTMDTYMGSDPEYDSQGRICLSDYDVSHTGIHYYDVYFYEDSRKKPSFLLRIGEEDENDTDTEKAVLYTIAY